jgi:hypothetical protein
LEAGKLFYYIHYFKEVPMSTHRNATAPKHFPKNFLEEIPHTDGMRRLYLYTCRTNDRHRLVVPNHSLDSVPGIYCPSCRGKLHLLTTFWEGDVPAAGYDADAAFEAIIRDGYFAWVIGESKG